MLKYGEIKQITWAKKHKNTQQKSIKCLRYFALILTAVHSFKSCLDGLFICKDVL